MSMKAECFDCARQAWGKPGASVVGLAIKNGIPLDEILHQVHEYAYDEESEWTVQDLAYALWRPSPKKRRPPRKP
jgi:hypothetical protein